MSLFQARHYEATALLLSELRPVSADAPLPGRAPAFVQWALTVKTFAEVLALDNPRFDKARFLKACRYGT
jgi:hypothetical protein